MGLFYCRGFNVAHSNRDAFHVQKTRLVLKFNQKIYLCQPIVANFCINWADWLPALAPFLPDLLPAMTAATQMPPQRMIVLTLLQRHKRPGLKYRWRNG